MDFKQMWDHCGLWKSAMASWTAVISSLAIITTHISQSTNPFKCRSALCSKWQWKGHSIKLDGMDISILCCWPGPLVGIAQVLIFPLCHHVTHFLAQLLYSYWICCGCQTYFLRVMWQCNMISLCRASLKPETIRIVMLMKQWLHLNHNTAQWALRGS